MTTLHMFISITFTETSIDETKLSRKSEAQNLLKMSTIHANKCIQTTTPLRNRCRHDGVVQQPPLPQQTFFQLFHIMDPRTVDPLLKDTPDAVVHRIQIWRIRGPYLWRDKIWRLCLQHGDSVTSLTRTVNGMISVTSTLGHQVRDVHGTKPSKFMWTRYLSCTVSKTELAASRRRPLHIWANRDRVFGRLQYFSSPAPSWPGQKDLPDIRGG